MDECIFTPCHGCQPRCLPIDTPESHAEHAMIDAELRRPPTPPTGRVVARTVQIDVRETLDLHTGYAREGWREFLWLSGWRARVAVFVLKLLR